MEFSAKLLEWCRKNGFKNRVALYRALSAHSDRKESWYTGLTVSLSFPSNAWKLEANEPHLRPALTAIGVGPEAIDDFFKLVLLPASSSKPNAQRRPQGGSAEPAEKASPEEPGNHGKQMPNLRDISTRYCLLCVSLSSAGLPRTPRLIIGSPFSFITYRKDQCAEILCGSVSAITHEEGLFLETSVEYHVRGVRLIGLRWLGQANQWEGIVELPPDAKWLYRLNVEHDDDRPGFGRVRGFLILQPVSQEFPRIGIRAECRIAMS